MLRYRIETLDTESDEFEVALFRPGDGLIWTDPDTEEQTPHEFYHTTLKDRRAREDRAVLFQSLENYEAVAANRDFLEHFHLKDKGDDVRRALGFWGPGALDDATRDVLRERVLEQPDEREAARGGAAPPRGPTFGEQVVVEGASPGDIALGDVFQAAGGRGSDLRVQVTSPRKPCYWVDRKNGTPMGLGGVKAFAQSRGLAGWFTRVLAEGELEDGMELVRTSHPHPEWTLEEVSRAMYGGEGKTATGAEGARAMSHGVASWGRSRRELRRLLEVEELGVYEWREEAEKLMDALPEEDEAEGGSWWWPGFGYLPFDLGALNRVLDALCLGQCGVCGVCAGKCSVCGAA